MDKETINKNPKLTTKAKERSRLITSFSQPFSIFAFTSYMAFNASCKATKTVVALKKAMY